VSTLFGTSHFAAGGMCRLPFLGVKIPDAKALRYFKICDTDGSGEIDVDEFKVALFICDPVSILLLYAHNLFLQQLGCYFMTDKRQFRWIYATAILDAH
jgi:hypothetical protein